MGMKINASNLGFLTKLLHTCRRGRCLERSSGVSATSHLADPPALQSARSNTIRRTTLVFFTSLTNFVLVQAEFSFHGNFPPVFFAGACRVRLDSLSCTVVSVEVCCARARGQLIACGWWPGYGVARDAVLTCRNVVIILRCWDFSSTSDGCIGFSWITF